MDETPIRTLLAARVSLIVKKTVVNMNCSIIGK
jgi:hypothetical protein